MNIILRKPLQFLSIVAFLIVTLQSCVLEEHYHFDKDLSGTYTMDFNFAALAENDSTGAMKTDMAETLDSLQLVMNDIEGVSNVKTEVTDASINLQCDFDGLATLNRMDEENEIDSLTGLPVVKAPVFVRKGKVLSIRPDIQGTNADLGGTEEEEPAGDEGDEMAAAMFQIITKVSFEGKVKVKEMEYFKKVDNQTFVFDSEVEGMRVQPVLVVKY